MKLALLLLFLTCAVSAHATDLRLKGTQGYSLSADRTALTIKLGGIINNSPGKSGTIKVQLWALPSPFVKSDALRTGTLIGECQLPQLDGGTSFLPLERTVPVRLPAKAGNYSMCLLVCEYRTEGKDGFVITDSMNFTQKASLAPR